LKNVEKSEKQMGLRGMWNENREHIIKD